MEILIVEDESLNFMFIRELLSLHNYSYLHANNGQEAVDLCRNKPEIALVLMDIKMPRMDGYEATRQIKKHRPQLPVVALTAYALSEDQAKAFAAGCDEHMAKPINQQHLLGIIRKYIN